jgi:hypothetical protein
MLSKKSKETQRSAICYLSKYYQSFQRFCRINGRRFNALFLGFAKLKRNLGEALAICGTSSAVQPGKHDPPWPAMRLICPLKLNPPTINMFVRFHQKTL